jgi:proline iminopeptidase
VYDRRGEGRSADSKAQFTFDEVFTDIKALLKKYNLEKAHFLGHSFGGIVAVKLAEKYPDMVQSIVLVGAPVSLQESFRTIINRCEDIYKKKDDKASLGYINMLKSMDTTSLQYSSYSFMHAMQNGFYSPKERTPEAEEIRKIMKANPMMKQYGGAMTYSAPQGFWKNEKYTTMHLGESIKQLKESGARIYGIYGKEDGLYSEEQVMELQEMLNKDSMKYLDNCSHNVFVDRQTTFIKTLKTWLQ